MSTQMIELFAQIFDFFLFFLPVVVPAVLIYIGFGLLVDYTRQKYFNSLEWVLFEIVPSPHNVKSPAAMELFLLALYQTSGESTWIDRIIKGKVRTWFTLELASIDGQVKFFMRCEKKMKKFIESQLYAQFPGLEVRDAEDYSMRFNTKDHDLMAMELELAKPDPYPIKTYIDYQLDKEAEEEFKIDPMTPVIEFLGSISGGEYAAIQIIVRAHKKEDADSNKMFPSFAPKVDNWKKNALSEITKIKKESFIEVEDADGKKKQNIQTESQKRVITALDRSTSKFAFDTGIRLLYVAEKDVFNKGNFGLLTGTFKQYNSDELNAFKPRIGTSFDYPWQDMFGRKERKMKKEMLEAFQTRNYFWKSDYKKNKRPYFILNTEELATIYHFPGLVAQSPSLSRVDSRKEAPPSNLPL